MSKEISVVTKHSAWYFFCVLTASIFIAETLIMLLFARFTPLSAWASALLDSSLLLTFTFPVLYLTVFRPLSIYIAEHKRAEIDLSVAAVAFQSRESMIITDADNVILRVNQAFVESTGYSAEEVIGRTPNLLKSGLHDDKFYAEMWDSIQQSGMWYGEVLDKRKNGEIYPKQLMITAVRDKNNEITHYVGMHSDISAMKKIKGDVTRAGLHDPLTGLPNRILFSERMHSALALDIPYRILAVVMIDLDNFKQINDTHGHEVGDKVLIEVARLLNDATRDSDVVARLGGDEFVVLLDELTGIEACEQTLERLRTSLASSYSVNGLNLSLSASIGATMHPNDKSDPDGLLRHADEAMYLAKHGGKNRFVLFDTSAAAKRTSTQQKLERLQQALENNEFQLHYQPQVDMQAGKVIGMEALIRWESPELGRLLPGEFMPLVESSDLALPIGRFAMWAAIAQQAKWLKQGFNWRMSINISPRHLEHVDFIDDIKAVLASHPEVSPQMIELEIVESAALEDIENVISIMQAAREIGVHFALDDFGTGHASLTYLRRLPVRCLKIDQSFVRDMLDDPSDLVMVEGMTSLAHTFDREVLAEGVESLQLGTLLIQIGCRFAQGFAIARPMPADEVIAWSKQWHPAPAWTQVSQRRWRRDDLPLLFAALSHRIWVSNMQKLVDGNSAAIPELDHHLCRFGRWQYGLGLKRYGEFAEFAEITPIHTEVHQTGHRIVKHLNMNQHEEAQQEMYKLYDLRDRLIAKMDILAERVTTSD